MYRHPASRSMADSGLQLNHLVSTDPLWKTIWWQWQSFPLFQILSMLPMSASAPPSSRRSAERRWCWPPAARPRRCRSTWTPTWRRRRSSVPGSGCYPPTALPRVCLGNTERSPYQVEWCRRIQTFQSKQQWCRE